MVGVRPRIVEYEFAVGVGFQVGGRSGNKLSGVMQDGSSGCIQAKT